MKDKRVSVMTIFSLFQGDNAAAVSCLVCFFFIIIKHWMWGFFFLSFLNTFKINKLDWKRKIFDSNMSTRYGWTKRQDFSLQSGKTVR